MIKIPFNQPYLTGKELAYIQEAVQLGKISGDGIFTRKCEAFFEKRYGFGKCFLTTSCTDALEMCAILLDIQAGDEVIIPSFTFVSSANAFVLRGAKIVLADSSSLEPNLDIAQVEALITSRTKAILVMHYAGIGCEMDKIMALAENYKLWVIEDAAQAIEGYWDGKALGGWGHLATFSFHETKNIIAGEGGLLVVNEPQWIKRAEIIREKGTNRSAFFRGEIAKYSWVDIGSSFLPSEIIAAFLWAQLENLDDIQARRRQIWENYYTYLKPLEDNHCIRLPYFPPKATNNYHIFYLLCQNLDDQTALIHFLKEKGIQAIFHYIPLHLSPYYQAHFPALRLPNAERYSDTLVRLPFYYGLEASQQKVICQAIQLFFNVYQGASL